MDILVPEKNIAFEFNGTYWHCEKNGKDKYYHFNKTKECDENSIKLIQIFSQYWNEKPSIIKSRIKQIFNLTDNSIYARKCKIEEIDTDSAKIFLEKNHLDGYSVSKIKMGLFYNEKLVSVMTFGKNRFEKSGWELIRFANLINYNIVGGASKLFKNFLKKYKISKITSFSDNTWGYTTFYEKLGFKLISKGTPGYYYVNLLNPSEIIPRMQVQKHKLVRMGYDSNLTEIEIMESRGFSRVWDCGHSKWVYKK